MNYQSVNAWLKDGKVVRHGQDLQLPFCQFEQFILGKELGVALVNGSRNGIETLMIERLQFSRDDGWILGQQICKCLVINILKPVAVVHGGGRCSENLGME